MAGVRDLLELVRAPAALSVPGDVAAGAAAARVLGPRTAGLACASICLYWAGMAANDWADRHLDAVERPERPIPSGRVGPGAALGVAAGLTAAGVALAGLAGGRRALAVAAPLAAAVWAYDVAAKNTRAGPLAMAVCRGLDVLLGAAPGRSPGAALPAALTIAAHTYLLTVLSRGETAGTTRDRPATTLTCTLTLATTTALRPSATASSRSATSGSPPATAIGPPASAALASPAAAGAGELAVVALSAWYAAQFGAPQARAVAEPSADRVRAAVTAGIVGLPALQGALVARAGAPRVGLALAAAVPLARRLARKLSPT
ncbi:SCO3242 family prenyltransferase [Nonomuraea candida]|uniref:SCO3242 family prenyltransferase n=1 Tax=Nonomuraea candida TaxID=359159 RepID=UPI0005BE3815|nr:UbiA family prenyltransferase [Nonomuraea candida]